MQTVSKTAAPAAATALIRDSTNEDLSTITKIYAQAVREGSGSFETEPPDLAEMKRRRDAILDAGYPYLAATVNGQLVGYCYASLYRTRKAYRFSCENSVYVDPAYQRQGIGQQLLNALIQRCEVRGDRLMIAVIGDSSNESSIRLHKSAGFSHAGILPSVGWKFGRWLDTVLMVRALGQGNKQPPSER